MPTWGPLRVWGDMALSSQQKRLWVHLIDKKDCSIAILFESTKTTHEAAEARSQQQFVGMLVYRINQKLKGSGYHIRCGKRRFTYRLANQTANR